MLKGHEGQSLHLHFVAPQISPEYLELNPMGQVPALVINGHTLTQSVRIT
jgi:glutathione S-transferase